MNKQTVIDKLIQDDIESIMNGGESGVIYLTELLRFGHIGWQNQTNTELEQEYTNRFSPAEQCKIR